MIPDSIRDVINQSVDAEPNAQLCVEKAFVAVQALPDYPLWVGSLVKNAVQEMVFSRRHTLNVRIKNSAAQFTKSYNTNLDGKSAVEEVKIKGILDSMYFGGRLFGDLRGEEIDPLAQSMLESAKGATFKAKLLLAARKLVPDGFTVREKITAKKADAIHRATHAEVYGKPDMGGEAA